jgi:hypothetical protein
VPVTLPGTASGTTFNLVLPVVAPTRAALGSDFVTWRLSAEDTGGRASAVTASCTLVANSAPIVSFSSPNPQTALTLERSEAWIVDVSDDTVLAPVQVVLADVAASERDGGVFLPSSSSEVHETRLRVNGWPLTVAATGDGLSIQQGVSVQGAQALDLTLDAPATVAARYRWLAQDSQSVAVTSFLATAPNGVRTQTTSSPPYSLHFDVPPAPIEVLEIELTVTRAGSVERYVIGPGIGAERLAAQVAGRSVFLSPSRGAGAAARTLRATGTVVVVPPPISPLTFSALACDVLGRCGVATRPVISRADLTPPSASISAVQQVVTGQPYQVSMSAADNVGVDRLELLVDGVVVAERTGFSLTGWATQLTAPPVSGTPLTLTVRATDRAGNVTTSNPSFVTVGSDQGPSIQFINLSSAVESISAVELQSGIVRLLQGQPATLNFNAQDDVRLTRAEVLFNGVTIRTETLNGPSVTLPAVFTPPAGADDSPSVLSVRVEDSSGGSASRQLLIQGRRPVAPALALVLPKQSITAGSIQLVVRALAGDDTGIAFVDVFLNNQPALQFSAGQGRAIPAMTADGGVIAADPDDRSALLAMPEPFSDPMRSSAFQSTLQLPPGLLQPGTRGSVELRVVATDREGSQAIITRTLQVLPDEADPVVAIQTPTTGQPVTEGTLLRVQALASDNVFVDRVEVLAGPTTQSLQLVHTASGFPPVNALAGSDLSVYAPVVAVDVAMPTLASLGVTGSSPFIIASRARDSAGRWSQLMTKQIAIIADIPPTVSIASPLEGSNVVLGQFVDVNVLAQDNDVAVTRRRSAASRAHQGDDGRVSERAAHSRDGGELRQADLRRRRAPRARTFPGRAQRVQAGDAVPAGERAAPRGHGVDDDQAEPPADGRQRVERGGADARRDRRAG